MSANVFFAVEKRREDTDVKRPHPGRIRRVSNTDSLGIWNWLKQAGIKRPQQLWGCYLSAIATYSNSITFSLSTVPVN